MKGIKRLAVFSAIGFLEIASLTGCIGEEAEENTNEEVVITTPPTEEEIFSGNVAIEQLQEDVKVGEKKTFAPYEHLFFIRVNLLEIVEYGEVVSGSSINIPEGYKVLTIENYNISMGRGSQTGGYDIWFTNDVPVEVIAIYNKSLGKNDYSHFGVPIKDNEKEETIQMTK